MPPIARVLLISVIYGVGAVDWQITKLASRPIKIAEIIRSSISIFYHFLSHLTESNPDSSLIL